MSSTMNSVPDIRHLFRKGDLRNENLYEVPKSFKSKRLADEFEDLWRKYRTSHKNLLLLKLFLHSYGAFYFFLGLTQVVVKSLLLIIRVSVAEKFTKNGAAEIFGFWYGFFIFVLLVLQCWYDQWYNFKLIQTEIRVRAALTAAVYRKILRSSSFCIDNTSSGEILTLITKDVNSMEVCIRSAINIWTSIFLIFILFYLIFKKLGFFVIVTLFLVVLLPIQVRLAMKSMNTKEKVLKETVDRLQMSKDILDNIKIIAANVWGEFFKMKLHNLRLSEMRSTHQIFLVKLIIYINGFLWTYATFFLLMTIFVAAGKEVTTEIVFFIFDTHRNVGNLINITLSFAICDFAQTIPSLKRITDFLSLKESSLVQHSNTENRILAKDLRVELKKEIIFNDIHLNLKTGIFLLTGPGASGKTVLLKTLLGECECRKGCIEVAGSLSYASQKPWIFSGTIRQNIIFGQKFNVERYNQVLDTCGLLDDFKLLLHGDQTKISNHTNLSNSQKATINLARALYKKADIYLIDDTLSSLDLLLQKYIASQCVANFFHKKLVVFGTHDTNLFRESQTIVVNDGKIVFQNVPTPTETLKDWVQFSSEEDSGENEESQLLLQEETDICHERNRQVYKWWFQRGGGCTLFGVVILLSVLSSLISSSVEESVLSWSSNEEDLKHIINDSKMLLNKRRNIVTLQIFLMLLLVLVNLGFGVTFLSFVKRASIEIHDVFIQSVLNIFDVATVGHILNRLSRDLLNIDEIVPVLFYDLLKMVIPMVSAITVTLVTQKMNSWPLVLLFLILMNLKKIYVAVGRSLKRLEASSRTPIVNYLNDTINGLDTVKSQKVEDKLQEEFEAHLDLHISASFTYLCCTRAFSLAVGWTSTIFVPILFVAATSTTASVLVSSCLQFAEILNTVVLNWAEIENWITSLERIQQFTKMKQRHCCEIVGTNLGEIVFQNVSISYPNLNTSVLKNLTFTISPREKIAVIGRSNSGKSSLISALLNITKFSGRISVHGLNTNNLRSDISVILEESVIFKGSIRENLDPFQKHSNNELWDALEVVNLKKFIWDLNVDVFDTYIVTNIRHKQRLCLAKIIVEKSSIVILDDFLKNVDEDTESLVLKIFRTVLIDSTLLIVTNNSKIVTNCDRVMMLDGGKVLRFDTPSALTDVLLYKLLLGKNI